MPEFGSQGNPIPVDGVNGELKYLACLRGATGAALFFHRIGSFSSSVSNHLIDLYEIVCADGTQWHRLYFDPYHTTGSNMTPEGYTLIPIHNEFDLGFGVNGRVENFPYNLPSAVIQMYGKRMGNLLAREIQEKLDLFKFERNTINPYSASHFR